MLGPSVASIVPAAPGKPVGKSGSSSSDKGPPRPFGVFLGPVGYVVARFGIYLLHAVCAAYFVAAGLVYYVLPTTHVDALLGYYELTVNTRWFRPISTIHFLFAAVHGFLLVWAFVVGTLVWCLRTRFKRQTSSIKHRTASLLASLRGPRRGAVKNTHHKLSSISSLVVAVKPTRVGKVLFFVYRRVAAQKGLFDVESHDFELSFLLREIAETVLQACQAYQMSRLLPRRRLIRFYVSMLVVNCWATPLLHHFSGGNEPLKRLLCLLCDVLLDFVSVVGVPMWLALDYLAAFDPTTGTFQYVLFYNETWMVRMLNDAPLILLGSWLEAFSRLVFALSMFSTIDDVKKLIKRKGDVVTTAAPPKLTKSNSQRRRLPTRQRKLLVLWVHRAMLGFGALILGVQLHAEFKPEPGACALQIRPWLISYPACALVEINCFTDPDRTGTKADLEAIFGNLDAESLLQIVVRHCPQLEVSTRIKSFYNLLGLKVYNTTLAAWGVDAAITQTHHPNLRYLYFVRTTFPNATLPRGLERAQFNPKFKQVTVSSSNLDRLPETLHEYWPPEIAIHVEYSALTAYPPTLTKLGPSELSLSYNQITALPEEAFQLMGIVAFTGNPIAALPEQLDMSLVPGGIFLLDRTLLAHPLPLWIDEAFVSASMLFLGGSPFCEQVALNESSDAYAELLETRPWLVDGQVDCSLFDLFFYPLGVDVRASEGLGDPEEKGGENE